MNKLDSSSLVGCREIKSIYYNDKKNGKTKLTIVEYIPYGALQNEELNTKLWGIVTNYDGSLVWTKGAVVCVSLESALDQLKQYKKSWAK